jgi:sulfite oxidase
MLDPAVQEMPVQSLITSPAPHDIVAAAKAGNKSITVKGIAWGGGGQGVNRVDVSLDSGKTFTRADLLEKPVVQRRRSEWGWVFFEKTILLPEELRERLEAGEQVPLELTSKTFNSAWNVQPESINWNAHGCCVNHWYRVPVTLCPRAEEDVRAPEGEFANKPSGGAFAVPFRNLDSPQQLLQRQSG